MKTIRVCAAILKNRAGEIWCAQRGYGPFRGLYEFPGGKLEQGETAEQALVREIREELDCHIQVEQFFMKAEYDYPDFHLDMDCYLCRFVTEPHLLEHMDGRFMPLDRLQELPWLPADVQIVQRLQKQLQKKQ